MPPAVSNEEKPCETCRKKVYVIHVQQGAGEEWSFCSYLCLLIWVKKLLPAHLQNET